MSNPLLLNYFKTYTNRKDSQNYRILLAEDNIDNQMVAKHLLENQGHTIITAPDGKKALEMLGKGTFDLVLIDIHMLSSIGAFEATRIIRKREKKTKDFKHIPIIAMTTHTMKGDRERCIASGMDDYISKPINPKLMTETVNQVIKKSQPEINQKRLRSGNNNINLNK